MPLTDLSLSPRAFLLASFFLFSFFPLESSRSSLDRSSYFNFQHFSERAFQKHLSRINRNPASPPSLSTRDPIKRLTKQTKGGLSWLAPGPSCLSPRVTAPEESHGSPATTERMPLGREKTSFFAPSPPLGGDYDYPEVASRVR